MAHIQVTDENQHLSGGIKVVKDNNKDNNIVVAESAISQFITQRENLPLTFMSKDSIIDKIQSVYYSLGFSSRFIGMDMFDNRVYSETDPEFKNKYLDGINSVYEYPHGIIMYHSNNEIFYRFLIIEFMCNDCIIPLKFTNISDDNTYKVERSDKTIQSCVLGNNRGFTVTDEKCVIVNFFSKDPTDELNPDFLTDLQKGVDLKKFIKINNLDFKVNFPYFSKDECENSKNPFINEAMLHYNKRLDELKTKYEKHM